MCLLVVRPPEEAKFVPFLLPFHVQGSDFAHFKSVDSLKVLFNLKLQYTDSFIL